MEDLPDDLLSLIARRVLEKEKGMKLWCQLASTCTRLWSFQLPPEPVYLLRNRLKTRGFSYCRYEGFPWTLGRLQEACKLNLSLIWNYDDQFSTGSKVVEATMQACQGLTSLKTLELQSYGNAEVKTHCQPWMQKLLLGAPSLTALTISTDALPRAPVIQHLHLRHLELEIPDVIVEQTEELFVDISCCHTLESLVILDIDLTVEPDSQIRPSMHLHSMPRLKHVRLVDCLLVGALSLPADCALFLDGCCYDDFAWQTQYQKFQGHTNVLRLSTNNMEWPIRPQGFSNLNYFELRLWDFFLEALFLQDLADLQHIPHVRIASEDKHGAYQLKNSLKGQLQLTSGSWQSLEVFFFGELDLTIRDVDTFVRDTKRFTFSLENMHKAADPPRLFQEIVRACRRRGKACHVNVQKAIILRKEVTYVTLSTGKEIAEKFPVIYDDNHEEGPAIGLMKEKTHCHWRDFWPRDPCASVKGCASVKQRLRAEGQLCVL